MLYEMPDYDGGCDGRLHSSQGSAGAAKSTKQDIDLADYLGIDDSEGENTRSKQQTARAGQM